MRKTALTIISILFFGLPLSISFGQSSLMKFGVTEAGVYKISSSDARQAGFSSLDELAVYGYPGMLPQILDSTQLELQEIPAWKEGDFLFFFLEGPHTASINELGEIQYNHHLYTDTLKYLLGKKASPKRIQAQTGVNDGANPGTVWYSIRSFKEEKINLLNSGRSWYSDPIRTGQSLNISFGISSQSSEPWLMKAKVMAQPSTSSQIRIFSGNDLLSKQTFDPIPNSTYGIKGRASEIQLQFNPAYNRLNQIRVTFQGSGSGHLDFISLGIPVQNSTLSSGIFYGKTEELISLPTSLNTWEISDFYHPKAFTTGISAKGKKWVIFSQNDTKAVQNLQPKSQEISTAYPELLIITSPLFNAVALKLRDHKLSKGIPAQVVPITDIFDQFGYGNKDLTAIRNFIASQYHAGSRLKQVLILGKGTFDYKNKLGGRPNLIPIYTSRNSLDPLRTFSSDDFLGLIEWGQGEWEESQSGDEPMKIGVGRVPAITFEEANIWVEKLIRYENLRFQLPFNQRLIIVADDGDNSIHMRDAEVHADFLSKNHPFFGLEKLYLDRFEQIRSGGTQSSPQLRTALEQNLEQGALILNYIGHGNETTLTAEEIFRVQDIADWANQDQLALWMTATCEFGRHDSPFFRSAAEELLFSKNKGAISLLSTGRPVFSSVNFSLNQAFIEEVFRKVDFNYQSLGNIFKNTKNKSLNGSLNRNFSLLGDPSMFLNTPELGIKLEKISDATTGNDLDSIRPFQKVQYEGIIIDPMTEATLPNFNGFFRLELSDKPVHIQTFGDENTPFEFKDESDLLFKGEGEVKNGRFIGQFQLPAEIDPEFATVNLRLVAWDSTQLIQAGGVIQPIVGGISQNPITDKTGPEIQAQIAGKKEGPLVIPTRQVSLKAEFSDESGIYISSRDRQKSLSIQINQGPLIPINHLFKALEGGFQKGEITMILTGLIEGMNQIRILAWDNAGNKSELSFTIEVRGSERISILEHRVYPNPASEKSSFFFRHNRPGENLEATLEVYSTLGQILFSDSRRLVKANEIIDDWHWIFLQSMTKYPAKGTYIYKLTLKSESDLDQDSVSGKLLIQ